MMMEAAIAAAALAKKADYVLLYLGLDEISESEGLDRSTLAIPRCQIETLKASGDCYILPAVTTYYLYLNCDHLTDWRVRAAIALCIDRENIVENVTQGGQIPAASLVTGGITDSTGALWQNGTGYKDIQWAALTEMYPDYDLTSYAGRCELAQALLAEAVADGFDTSVTIPYRFNNLGTHGAIAEAVQQDLGVLGIEMGIEQQDWNVFLEERKAGNFDFAREGWIADFNDPINMIEMWTTESGNNDCQFGRYEGWDA